MTDAELLLIETRTHGRALFRRARVPGAGTLVGFHGYAEQAATQLDRLAGIPGADDWNLLSIQGLHRFYRARTREPVAGWMTREDRLLAIRDNIAYVDAAIAAIQHEIGDALVFVGFSQGGAMAFRAAAGGRRHAHGVVAVASDVPPELLADPDVRFPPVLLLRGTADPRYSQQQMDADAAALASRGVEVRAEVSSGDHEWTAAVSAAIGDFLKHL